MRAEEQRSRAVKQQSSREVERAYLVPVRLHEHHVHARDLAGNQAEVATVVHRLERVGRERDLHVVALLHRYVRHLPRHLHIQTLSHTLTQSLSHSQSRWRIDPCLWLW